MKKTLALFIFMLCLLSLCAAGAGAEEKTALFPARGENGKIGYIDRAGEWVIAPQFDSAGDFRGDYASVSVYPEDFDPETDDLWDMDCEGIIDREGNFVLPPVYSLGAGQDGSYFGGRDAGIWLVYRRGDYAWGKDEEGEEILLQYPLYGFFDIPSGCFSGLKWDDVWPWCSDSRLIPVMDDDGAGYADRSTGEMVIPCQYFDCDPGNFHEGVASVAFVDEDWNPFSFFLIDETGAEIPLPEGIHSLCRSYASEGRITVENEQELRGYADLQGNVVIPPQFLWTEGFQDGFALVMFQEGDWGFIDRDGNTVSRGMVDTGRWGPDFANGALAVQTAPDVFTVCAVTGEELFAFTFTENLERFHLYPPMKNGLCWFCEYEKGGRSLWGLVNLRGEVVSEAQWQMADFEPKDFPEGLQLVMQDGKWGFIDATGQIALPLIYDWAYSFENGLAWVEIGNRCGYIDREGREVFFWDAE
ncbi:MAG: WG repeat-containing protein [Lachnospiraceae bacterium]|nr:WG repeat-containing protein [Lachnospiraceae bacterium]